ncbi:hypothetical protein K7X08_010112 [Anisodus acutangulus]|uniref:Uncharacterized protein n=1 Tax=Anisodus acutangulus TaxID=402998 RepID=A0A9Q1N504_9SOLA|nr:hypothetical protein K7X08_010112 [Anisodus acutangulus]
MSCPKIVSLGVAELSGMLRQVEIARCEALEVLHHESHCLEELEIEEEVESLVYIAVVPFQWVHVNQFSPAHNEEINR